MGKDDKFIKRNFDKFDQNSLKYNILFRGILNDF